MIRHKIGDRLKFIYDDTLYIRDIVELGVSRKDFGTVYRFRIAEYRDETMWIHERSMHIIEPDIEKLTEI